MADTAHYGWTKPTVAGSTGAWGTILNTLFDAVDSALYAVDTVASAAFPASGGALTGRLDSQTETLKHVDAGSVSGAHSFDCSAAQVFSATMTGALTPTFTNVPNVAGQAFGVVLFLTNGGSAAITWPTGTLFPGGTQPALSSAGTDILVGLTKDGGATWFWMLSALDETALS